MYTKVICSDCYISYLERGSGNCEAWSSEFPQVLPEGTLSETLDFGFDATGVSVVEDIEQGMKPAPL
jgi:hypothetical protein